MSKFADKTGHEWQIKLDVGNVQEVKDETGVNLSIVSKDTSWIDTLFSDPGQLVAVLHVLLADQIATLQLSPMEFARRFDGETLGRAGDALMGAMADFFPRSRIAQAIRQKLPKLMEKAETEAIQRMDRIELTASNSATNSPGSVESIPVG